MNPIGLYLHTPFCVSKCPYCNFYSLPGHEHLIEDYVDSLIKYIKSWGAKLNRPADSLYFGGGTPSLLKSQYISQIIKYCKLCFGLDNSEITVEINPEHISDRYLSELLEAGANRISVGIQSAIAGERASLGRPDYQFEKVSNLINSSGFENISYDLMLGIPEQNMESLKKSLEIYSQSGATHVSAYILKLEKGTKFYEQRNSLNIADEDEAADFYLSTCLAMEKSGFAQYEISNFAKPGFESKHNLKYWNCVEYLGIGPSAHSYIDGQRFFYPSSLNAFVSGTPVVQDGKGGEFSEYVMLRLRLKEGLKVSSVKRLFGFSIPNPMIEEASKLSKMGFINIDDSGFNLTSKGFLISNKIIFMLLESLETN